MSCCCKTLIRILKFVLLCAHRSIATSSTWRKRRYVDGSRHRRERGTCRKQAQVKTTFAKKRRCPSAVVSEFRVFPDCFHINSSYFKRLMPLFYVFTYNNRIRSFLLKVWKKTLFLLYLRSVSSKEILYFIFTENKRKKKEKSNDAGSRNKKVRGFFFPFFIYSESGLLCTLHCRNSWPRPKWLAGWLAGWSRRVS